jgi:DNA invertase Pin-like site-specific DNA recombinase
MQNSGSLSATTPSSGGRTECVNFVAYYRVSTDEQGKSGLGLEAQREAVARHIGANALLDQFEEVESGKSDRNRPRLHAALDLCKRKKAVLCIAKLDRLSRNVAFIANLMDSGVKFTACDNPHANELTIHVIAAVAQYERKMISERTKAALAAARARGVQLGNPNWQEPLAKALASRKLNPPPPAVLEMMQRYRSEGLTYRAIAAKLNEMDISTPKSPRYPNGCIWRPGTVHAALMAAAVLAVNA